MVSVQSFSEAGGHRLNEDAYAVQQHPRDPDLWLCFVADGQGGQANGGPAARLACQTALAAAAELSPDTLSHSRMWSHILHIADKAVMEDPAAGFTTAVGLCVSNRQVIGASVGDSAALLVLGDQAVELTSGQQKNPPIGFGAAQAVPFCAALKAPWQLLVMSDGVWKYVGWDRIVAAAGRKSGAALIEELQQSARLKGRSAFQDDFTIVLLEDTG